MPACQNLYKNSFTYHSLKEDKTLPFAECLEFIGKGLTVSDQGVVLFSVSYICICVCVYIWGWNSTKFVMP